MIDEDMTSIDPRAELDRLIRSRGEDYAGISRLIGRNAAYIQQFIKRGVPRKLDGDDRRTLARYFGVSETVLGAADPGGVIATVAERLLPIARLDIGASAGGGAVVDREQPLYPMSFDRTWLRRLTRAPADRLSIIRVQGDSMQPTLADGDDIMIDRSDGAERLRDGVYVLRLDDALMVKRLALNPVGGRVAVRSDNPAYPSWPDCPAEDINIIGRVVWVGRKLG